VLFIEFYYFSKKKKIPQAKGIFQGLEIKRKRKKKEKKRKKKYYKHREEEEGTVYRCIRFHFYDPAFIEIGLSLIKKKKSTTQNCLLR
jgi:hypothetical protein